LYRAPAASKENTRLNEARRRHSLQAYVSVVWKLRTAGNASSVTITSAASAQTEVLIPKNAATGQTIYLIFEATDNGTPAITRYRRVNVIVKK
jgi:hypothetical protein